MHSQRFCQYKFCVHRFEEFSRETKKASFSHDDWPTCSNKSIDNHFQPATDFSNHETCESEDYESEDVVFDISDSCCDEMSEPNAEETAADEDAEVTDLTESEEDDATQNENSHYYVNTLNDQVFRYTLGETIRDDVFQYDIITQNDVNQYSGNGIASNDDGSRYDDVIPHDDIIRYDVTDVTSYDNDVADDAATSDGITYGSRDDIIFSSECLKNIYLKLTSDSSCLITPPGTPQLKKGPHGAYDYGIADYADNYVIRSQNLEQDYLHRLKAARDRLAARSSCNRESEVANKSREIVIDWLIQVQVN